MNHTKITYEIDYSVRDEEKGTVAYYQTRPKTRAEADKKVAELAARKDVFNIYSYEIKKTDPGRGGMPRTNRNLIKYHEGCRSF